MSDNTKDIDRLLRYLSGAADRSFTTIPSNIAADYYAALTALVAERDGLLAELAAAQKQRDEAMDIAATHKRNWYEAKTEYGAAMGKIRAELDAAQKQRDEALRDAERYRWLKSDRCDWVDIQSQPSGDWVFCGHGSHVMDAAIDAAIATQKEGGGA
jgi:hypothetical protein